METIPIARKDLVEHVEVPKLSNVLAVGTQDVPKMETYAPIHVVQGILDLLPPLLLALGIQVH